MTSVCDVQASTLVYNHINEFVSTRLAEKFRRRIRKNAEAESQVFPVALPEGLPDLTELVEYVQYADENEVEEREETAIESQNFADASSSPACYTCGENGHYSRDCPTSDQACMVCQSTEHFAKDCPDLHWDRVCHNCSQRGHVSKDCPEQSNGRLCYNCQQLGHVASDCANPQVKRPRGGRKMFAKQQAKTERGGHTDWRKAANNRRVSTRTFGSGANSVPVGVKS